MTRPLTRALLEAAVDAVGSGAGSSGGTSPIAFGCAGNGTTNDTTNFQAALNSLGYGATLSLGAGKYLLDTVTIPDGVTISGSFGYAALVTSGTNPYAWGSQMRLRAGATITSGEDCAITDCLVIRDGLTLPISDNTGATALLAQFAGTGITGTGKMLRLRNLLILGFALGVDATETASQGALDCQEVRGDCLAGIKYKNSGDNGHWYGCHFWPFLTANISGVSTANIHRSGSAFQLDGSDGSGDAWTTLVDCFCYGYAKGFDLISGSGLHLIGCQTDYGSGSAGTEIGFKITGGTSDNSGRILLSGCKSITLPTCVSIDLQESSDVNHVRIAGCDFGSNGTGISLTRGSAVISGSTFQGGTTGISVGASFGALIVDGAIFDSMTDGIDVNSSYAGKGRLANMTFANVSGLKLNIPAAVLDNFTVSGVGNETAPIYNQFPGLRLSDSNAQAVFNASGAGADNRTWDIVATGGASLLFRTATDAGSFTTAFQVNRSGGTPTDVTFAYPAIVGATKDTTTNAAIQSGNGIELVANAGTSLIWKDTSGGADAKYADMFANSGGMQLRFLNDAFNAANLILSVARSGYTVTQYSFYAGSSTEQFRIVDGLTSCVTSFGRGTPVTKTNDFTVAATENWLIVNKSSTVTATLPAASSFVGREIMIKTIQAQAVVSNASNVVPLAGGSAGTAILAATAGKWATLVSDGTSWVIMAAA